MKLQIDIAHLQDILKSSFTQPSVEERWHATMKNGDCPNDSLHEDVQKFIDHRSVRGWTPLHVAVLANNRAGVECLLKRNALSSLKDASGYTPIDYARLLHPEMLSLFVFPHHYHHEPSRFLKGILKKWLVELPPKTCENCPNTNDFENVTKELLIAKEIKERVENPEKTAIAGKTIWEGYTFSDTPQNMKAIATELGISLQSPDIFYSVRDPYIRLKDGSIRVAYESPHYFTAIFRTHSSNLYLNKTSATRTKNQFFNTWTGYTQTISAQITRDSKKFFGDQVQRLENCYLEGGNVWTVTNPAGEVKVFIGSDHLTQSLHLLALEMRSWDDLALKIGKPFAELQNEFSEKLTVGEIRQSAEELYAEGVLKLRGVSGLLEPKQQLDLLMMRFMLGDKFATDDKDWFKKVAVQSGIIKNFDLNDAELESCRNLIAGHLARKKITQGLIASDLGVKPENIHYLPQVNYHLDTFCRPGPDHSMFVISFAMAAELLSAIVRDSESFNLSDADAGYLERYLVTAKMLNSELGSLIKEVEREVEKAGFKVIPMPGCFIYESATMYQEFPMPSGGYNMNFINSLTGWSPKTGKYYYITHGLAVGDKLGDIIMDSFMHFLRSYVPEVDVYFIGRNPKDLADLSEAMDWWNRLDTQSGIHCTSFELK